MMTVPSAKVTTKEKLPVVWLRLALTDDTSEEASLLDLVSEYRTVTSAQVPVLFVRAERRIPIG